MRRIDVRYIATIVPVTLFAAFLALTTLPFVDRIREIVFDTYQTLSPRHYDPSLPVRIVALDEKSLRRIGQWPWPRDTIARLTEVLTKAGAAAIAFDIVFGEADQNSPDQLIRRLPQSPERDALERVLQRKEGSHDEVLATAIANGPVVLGYIGSDTGAPIQAKAGFASAGDDPKPWLPRFDGAVVPIPPLLAATPGLGAVNWIPDGDSVIRKVPTVITAGGALGPSLSLEALRLAQGAGTIVIRASNASGETAFGSQTGINAVKVGD